MTVNRGHIGNDDFLMTIMDATEDPSSFDFNGETIWHASTPMTLDIDYTAALYGRATDTRLGNDTYGFNAYFDNSPYQLGHDDIAQRSTSTSTCGRWSPSSTTAASTRSTRQGLPTTTTLRVLSTLI